MENSPQGLLFFWQKNSWWRSPLPGLLLASLLFHALAFVILQVVPPEKVTAPDRERELQLLSSDIPAHQSLLAAVEAESPVAALSHQLLPVEDLLQRPYQPASVAMRSAPREPERWSPVKAGAPMSFQRSAATPAPSLDKAVFKGKIQMGNELTRRVSRLPEVPCPNGEKSLENPVFWLGVGAEGAVKFVFIQKSSGDSEEDALAERLLRKVEFQSGAQETTWGEATIYWSGKTSEP